MPSVTKDPNRIKVKDFINQLSLLDQEEYIVLDDGVGNYDNNGQIIIQMENEQYVIF